jgi:hypothetical protein
MGIRKYAVGVTVLALLVGGLTACGGGQGMANDANAIMQSPITPIVLRVAKSGLISVAEDSGDPLVSGVALVAVAGISPLQDEVIMLTIGDVA